MKKPFLSALAMVALAFVGVAQAGPLSPLYLTYSGTDSNIIVVQGNSIINTFPEAYGSPIEIPIAVSGDVRTIGAYPGSLGGQYTLGGTPTGTSYVTPSVISDGGVYDSTTDGTHNYLVDFDTGVVYQTARDFTNPVALFNVSAYELGITYDAVDHSLWISDWAGTMVTQYSLSGTALSSFDTGYFENGALALDPGDQTLWMVTNGLDNNLRQYSKAGALLSVGPNVGYTLGGEFNETPEPGSWILFGSGMLGLGSLLRRKIKL